MLDNHSRIAAIAHIVLGFLSLLLLACLAVFFHALAEIVRNAPGVVEFITGAGTIILGLALFNVPVGTVTGGYSLWALLRK